MSDPRIWGILVDTPDGLRWLRDPTGVPFHTPYHELAEAYLGCVVAENPRVVGFPRSYPLCDPKQPMTELRCGHTWWAGGSGPCDLPAGHQGECHYAAPAKEDKPMSEPLMVGEKIFCSGVVVNIEDDNVVLVHLDLPPEMCRGSVRAWRQYVYPIREFTRRHVWAEITRDGVHQCVNCGIARGSREPRPECGCEGEER